MAKESISTTLEIWQKICNESLLFSEAFSYCKQKAWENIPPQQILLMKKSFNETVQWYTNKKCGSSTAQAHSSSLHNEDLSYTAAACLVLGSTFEFASEDVPSTLITHIFDNLIHLQQMHSSTIITDVVGSALINLTKLNEVL
jgi:hypothetical protein